MKVTYVDHMGSDLSVVNAARVSFDKESSYVEDAWGWHLPTKDVNLIDYLAKHKHWTPFAHTAVSLRIKAPIFVARQLGKHQVGLVWNEVSRRYVDADPEFYWTEEWRGRAPNVKQGSSSETVELDSLWGFDTGLEDIEAHHRDSVNLYQHLLEQGVCAEQARMVLPQSMMTEWIWTGSIAAFARVVKLRLDPHTQKETREIAAEIDKIIKARFPYSWKALMA